ncbi:MAG: EthD domain-containing protein [Pseudomonadota bacterium]
MIKLVYLIKKRQDLTDAEFKTYWRETHSKLIEESAPTLRAVRYAMSLSIDTLCNTCVAKPRGLSVPDYEGVIEIWWNNLDDYIAGAGAAAGIAAIDAIVDGERRFIDFANSASFFTEEEVVFDWISTQGSSKQDQITFHSKFQLSNETSTTSLIK